MTISETNEDNIHVECEFEPVEEVLEAVEEYENHFDFGHIIVVDDDKPIIPGIYFQMKLKQ